MTEVSLFIIVGALAVAAAVLMLLSENAVHSALFLIVTMLCIAFLFLMLNAPFLFLVQITVYTGAIMVLFLFVIMLLGAERLSDRSDRFRWLTPLAMVLAFSFLFSVGLSIGQGPVDPAAFPGSAPMVRVAHVAPEVGAVDVYANDQIIAADVAYTDATEFLTLPPGEYNLALFEAGTQNALLAAPLALADGFIGTVVAHGTGLPELAIIPNDLSAVEERSARLTIFNAYSGAPAVDLVDLGSELVADDTEIVLAGIAQGTTTEPLILPETTTITRWAFAESGSPDNILFELTLPSFELERDTAKLVVLADETSSLADTVNARAVPFVAGAAAIFGSPQAVGQSLFTDYVLPMQMVALLLLVAMIGAIVLTHKPKEEVVIQRGGRRRVSRPLTSVISAQTGSDIYRGGNGAPAELPEPADEPAQQ
jgi:NADH:ubiquinone oxidoreductase subunit 6 (subunit J)